MQVFVVMQTNPDRSSEMNDRPMDVKSDKQAAEDLAKGLGGWVEEFTVDGPVEGK
jgi:hypothetical protein